MVGTVRAAALYYYKIGGYLVISALIVVHIVEMFFYLIYQLLF